MKAVHGPRTDIQVCQAQYGGAGLSSAPAHAAGTPTSSAAAHETTPSTQAASAPATTSAPPAGGSAKPTAPGAAGGGAKTHTIIVAPTQGVLRFGMSPITFLVRLVSMLMR